MNFSFSIIIRAQPGHCPFQKIQNTKQATEFWKCSVFTYVFSTVFADNSDRRHSCTKSDSQCHKKCHQTNEQKWSFILPLRSLPEQSMQRLCGKRGYTCVSIAFIHFLRIVRKLINFWAGTKTRGIDFQGVFLFCHERDIFVPHVETEIWFCWSSS